MQNIVEEDGVLLIVMSSLQAHCALSNSNSREVLTETFNCEGGDGFILFEDRAIVKNVAVGTGVMVTPIVAWEAIVEDWKGGKNSVVFEMAIPGIAICVRG